MKNRSELIALFERKATEVAEREIKGVDESTVMSALGIDSLGMLELVGTMEKELGIHIPDDQLVGLTTIKDLIELIEERAAA
ncbi:MAG: acyl carrier protein [Deltaproteobacteria bacterium]|nr:acyl carrier protein [Deltaproteobacteria bacterium]